MEIAAWFEDASGSGLQSVDEDSHVLAIAVAVVAFSLLAVIAIQSIALHDLKENSEAIRKDADAYRQVMEIAEEQAASLQADMAVKPPSSP